MVHKNTNFIPLHSNNPFTNDIERDDDHNKNHTDNYLCKSIFICIFILTTIIFCFLWLAESQFTHGILRLKYIDEPCSHNSSCSNGLTCIYGSCKVMSTVCSPYDDYYNYGNGTPNPNGYPKDCPVCPEEGIQCPPQYVSNIVTYFDFNEFPNHWIDPGTSGFYIFNYDLPYGGCKELCAIDSRCKGICYNGQAKMCWQMSSYVLPPIYNGTYTCAIKTGG